MNGSELTRRESEILKLVSQGLGEQEIADRLFLSLFTVEVYHQNIITKLNASSTLEAVIRAHKLRLI